MCRYRRIVDISDVDICDVDCSRMSMVIVDHIQIVVQALISNPDNLKYVPDADGIVARSPALGIPCSLANFQPNEQWRTAGDKCFHLFKVIVRNFLNV
jgi:hypothetical protein